MQDVADPLYASNGATYRKESIDTHIGSKESIQQSIDSSYYYLIFVIIICRYSQLLLLKDILKGV